MAHQKLTSQYKSKWVISSAEREREKREGKILFLQPEHFYCSQYAVTTLGMLLCILSPLYLTFMMGKIKIKMVATFGGMIFWRWSFISTLPFKCTSNPSLLERQSRTCSIIDWMLNNQRFESMISFLSHHPAHFLAITHFQRWFPNVPFVVLLFKCCSKTLINPH